MKKTITLSRKYTSDVPSSYIIWRSLYTFLNEKTLLCWIHTSDFSPTYYSSYIDDFVLKHWLKRTICCRCKSHKFKTRFFHCFIISKFFQLNKLFLHHSIHKTSIRHTNGTQRTINDRLQNTKNPTQTNTTSTTKKPTDHPKKKKSQKKNRQQIQHPPHGPAKLIRPTSTGAGAGRRHIATWRPPETAKASSPRPSKASPTLSPERNRFQA